MTDSHRPTAALVASAFVGVAVAALGTVAMLRVRDHLPEELALHWGADGTPDRFGDFTEATVTTAVLVILAPLLLVALGAVMHRSVRGPLAGIAGGLAVGIGGLVYGGLVSQRPGEVADAFPTGWLLGTIPVALLVGFGLWWWGRVPPAPLSDPRTPLPSDAPRLDVPSGTTLTWQGAASVRPGGALALTLLILVPLLLVTIWSRAWWLFAFAVVLTAVTAMMFGADVVITADGLRVRTKFVTWAHVPIERVESADVSQVSPLKDFGGWGWRIGRDGRRGFVTRTGEALVVTRRGDTTLVVTVDDADQAAAVLNTLVARESAGHSGTAG